MTDKGCAYLRSGRSVAASSGRRGRRHRRSSATLARGHRLADVATDVATAGILLIGHCESPYDCEFTGASAVIPSVAMGIDDSLPIDLAGAHALIIAQRQAPSAAQERVAAAERGEAQYQALLTENSSSRSGTGHDRFGQSSERCALELQLADLEVDAAQADTAAQITAVLMLAIGGMQTVFSVACRLPTDIKGAQGCAPDSQRRSRLGLDKDRHVIRTSTRHKVSRTLHR